MIAFQVEDVWAGFKKLEKLQANSWIAESETENKEAKRVKEPKAVIRKKKAKPSGSKIKASSSLKATMAARRSEMKKLSPFPVQAVKVEEKVCSR